MIERPNKPVLFFAKLVFICNMCFVVSIIFRIFEAGRRAAGNEDPIIPLPPLETTIVILGLLALIVNGVFFVYFLYLLSARKVHHFPRLLVLINLLLFPVQIWYYFFFKT